MVLRPEKEAEAEAIFRKWGLDFAVVGRTTDDLRFRVIHGGEVEADLPIKDLGDEAPEYDRPLCREAEARRRLATSSKLATTPMRCLRLVGSPDMSSRRWVWEQYDHLIGGNTHSAPAATPRSSASTTTRRPSPSPST